ncbi:MAG: peptidylprolyl isomerase [Candidatus Binatia bacterium]
MKRIIVLVYLLMLVGVTSGRAEVVNRIVATVDGEPITLHELETFQKQAGQQGLFAPQELASGVVSEKDLLEGLIMNKLVDKEVETQGLKSKDADIDSYIERIKTQNNLNDEQFRAALAAQGMTLESYRKKVGQEIERAILINREIGSRVNVTPQDIERYAKEHAEEYVQPERIKVRLILLPLSPAAPPEQEKEVLALMQDIHKRAQGGEDFAKLADTHSQGPGAGQGGDLGYFHKGQMVKEIDEAAFALKAGEISQPFRTSAGVCVLKVEERLAASQKPSDEAAEEIKRKLYNEALRQRYQRWFQEDLRFRHHVENFFTSSTDATTSKAITTPTGVAAKDQKEEASVPATEKEPEKKDKPGFLRRLVPF